MKSARQSYPFVPRSTVALKPGHFWAIPLRDGSFGCGRVIQLMPRSGNGARVSFLAGVLDWHSEVTPNSELISGAECLSQGRAHLKVITETGGEILGFRSLEADSIEPWEFRGAEYHMNSHVYRGFEIIRPQQLSDSFLPVLSTWGYRVPVIVLEKRFLNA